MNSRKDYIILWISIISFLLMAMSFILMPFEFTSEKLKLLNLISGIMFWLFLVVGIITQIMLTQQRKRWLIRHHLKRHRIKKRMGLVSFFQNMPGCIADIVSVVSLIALIVTAILTDVSGFMCYIFLALFVFSFSMHCILNGKNYYFITNKQKIEEMQRKSAEGLK